ncbi:MULTISPECIES: hypothetical protein [unclassified Acinetobacter]|uniref:hypothetical protein n=1 Tax=Acinetobacter TaxID=469 RepID=UPI0018AC37CC|nr:MULTISPECIES: hypothetical protein [unclassified Acinetobacter]MBJ9953641.1 hypothetical protein [Acinetobacter baumannii]
MKLLKVCVITLLGMASIQAFANPIEDQYKALVAPQPSYAKFQKNFDTILGKIEEITERATQTQDRAELYPMCVAIQSSITVLKNNQKYKAQYDRDYKQFDTTFDETLASATQGLSDKKAICDQAKKEYLAQY